MILQIPVKPFVKHVLKQHYGREPIPVRANSDLGTIFLLAMNEKSWLRLAYSLDRPAEGDDEELVIDTTGKLTNIDFVVSGNFKNLQILPDKLAQIGQTLESYSKIFMKGFSMGYRCLLTSEVSSATAFWQLHNFNEDELSVDNCIKIIQRENREIRDLLQSGTKRRFKVLEKK
jgi:hypothetical protein